MYKNILPKESIGIVENYVMENTCMYKNVKSNLDNRVIPWKIDDGEPYKRLNDKKWWL